MKKTHYNKETIMIRSLLVVIEIGLFLILTLPVLLFLVLTQKNHAVRNNKIATKMFRALCKVMLFLCGAKVEVTGQENIPEGPVVYMANHRSYFDIVTGFANIPGTCGFVAKIEMQKIPVLRTWMSILRCFFLDRHDIRQGMKVILAASDQVKNDQIPVWIFPEGTRIHEDEPGEFKGGSCKIAEKSGAPILPVAFEGTDDIFENHAPWIKATNVKMHICKPIYPSELTREEKKVIADLVRNEIIEAIKGDAATAIEDQTEGRIEELAEEKTEE